jgi:hypothetical protein
VEAADFCLRDVYAYALSGILVVYACHIYESYTWSCMYHLYQYEYLISHQVDPAIFFAGLKKIFLWLAWPLSVSGVDVLARNMTHLQRRKKRVAIHLFYRSSREWRNIESTYHNMSWRSEGTAKVNKCLLPRSDTTDSKGFVSLGSSISEEWHLRYRFRSISLYKHNYLFDKKKGKKFFLFSDMKFCFMKRLFLHSARTNYVCGQSEEVSSSGGSSLEFWD